MRLLRQLIRVHFQINLSNIFIIAWRYVVALS